MLVKHVRLLLFISIFFLGFILRAQETISGNFLFLLDQGRDLLAVKQIISDHHPTLIGPYTGLTGVFQGPLWYYLLAIPTFILGGNPWGTVVLSLIMSMAVLGVTYVFLKKYFGVTVALVTTFLFAVSPEAAAAATYSWNPHPSWLLAVASIACLYFLLTKNIKAHLLLWPLVGLNFHFESAFGMFLLPAIVIYFVLFQKAALRSRYTLLGILFMLMLFLPQILFDLRHDFLMTKSVMKLFAGSNQGLFVTGEYLGYIPLIQSHMHAFINNFRSGFVHEQPFDFLPYLLFLVGVFGFLYVQKTRALKPRESIFLTMLFFIPVIFVGLSFFFPFPIRYWYLTGFQSFSIFFVGMILAKLISMHQVRLLMFVFFIPMLSVAATKLDRLYIHPPNDGGVAKTKGKLTAIDDIYKDAAGQSFGLLVFTPPVNTDAYDYLVWWRGRTHYGYIPHKEKRGLVYLLIEPDPAQPWSYKGWLETVIISGTVISTMETPSGFVIQKRVFDASSK